MGGVFEDGAGRIVVDDRHFPLLVTVWIGPVSVGILGGALEEIDRVLARARDEGTVLVQAADALRVGRVDGPGRQLTADSVSRQVSDYPDVNLRPAYVSMKNVIVRGTLRAMNWLARERIGVEPFPTFAEAGAAALDRMDREEIARPAGFDPAGYDPAGLVASLSVSAE